MFTTIAMYPTASLYNLKIYQPAPLQLTPLHWCCDERPSSGTALYMEWISAQPPIWRLPSIDSGHQPRNPQKKCTTCITLPLPSK